MFRKVVQRAVSPAMVRHHFGKRGYSISNASLAKVLATDGVDQVKKYAFIP